jgi:hypothetical protein
MEINMLSNRFDAMKALWHDAGFKALAMRFLACAALLLAVYQIEKAIIKRMVRKEIKKTAQVGL